MNIYVIGMPGSGRSTISKAICNGGDYKYIDATAWIKSKFRDKNMGEHQNQYLDDYHQWLSDQIKSDPSIFIDKIYKDMTNEWESDRKENINFIIDGLYNPKDFSHLFNYNKDIVIFLNRTDNETEYKDYENIGVSVIRDYCYWMSAAGFITKQHWLEYNFKINEAPSDHIKSLGSKNSVFIIKSISNVIKHLENKLKETLLEKNS